MSPRPRNVSAGRATRGGRSGGGSTAQHGFASRRRYAPVFAALGDETRLALVSRLSTGTVYSIAQLTEGTQLTRQAVTKHLRVLEGARIVRSERAGRETVFELDPAPMRELAEYVELMSQRWDAALLRLKEFVEE